MHRHLAGLITCALLLFCASVAQATTTTLDPSNKCANITLSNGNLTATKTTSNAHCDVLGTVKKYGGKYYYELTLTTSAAGNGGAGVCEDLQSNNLTQLIGYYYDGILGSNQWSDKIEWANASLGSISAAAQGKTIGVAVDLDKELIWINTDVVGTPATWNALSDGTQNPSTPTGGYRFDLYSVFRGIMPCVGTYNQNDVYTANFGATSFAGTVPTGFSSWNTTANEINPNGATITANIANAPKWAQNTAYSTVGHLGNWVVAGPGLTGSTGTFNSGSALYLLELTTAGTSSLTGDGPTISSCPSTGITDGTAAVWKCLSPVDYPNITDWFYDAPTWTMGTVYQWHDWVINNGHILRNDMAADTCTAGASFTSSNVLTAQSDGGCTGWRYLADMLYTSQAHYIPKDSSLCCNGNGAINQRTAGGSGAARISNYYVGQLWSGGAAQTEYLSGSNGETQPITTMNAFDFTNDVTSGETGVLACSQLYIINKSYNWPGCLAYDWPFTINLTSAPGESFRDNTSAMNFALAYNPALGVAIHNTAARNTGTVLIDNTTALAGAAINSLSSSVIVNGLQFKSDHAEAYYSGPHGNWEVLYNNIFDAGDGALDSVSIDGDSQFHDNTIFMRGTAAATAGIECKYACSAFNNTVQFIGTPGAHSACLLLYEPTANTVFFTAAGWPVNNNWCGGFTYALALGNSQSTLPSFTAINNNALDTASGVGPVGPFTCEANIGGTCYAYSLPGTSNVYSLTPSSQFLSVTSSPPPDYRLQSGSALRGAGANFSFNTGAQSGQGTLVNTTDILARSRPPYDIGAVDYFLTSHCGSLGMLGVGC